MDVLLLVALHEINIIEKRATPSTRHENMSEFHHASDINSWLIYCNAVIFNSKKSVKMIEILEPRVPKDNIQSICSINSQVSLQIIEKLILYP